MRGISIILIFSISKRLQEGKYNQKEGFLMDILSVIIPFGLTLAFTFVTSYMAFGRTDPEA
jgi:hypothetical protein